MHQVPRIFDRQAIKKYRMRHRHNAAKVTEILTHCADIVLDRLDDVKRDFSIALDIGGRDIVAPLLRGRGIETVSVDEYFTTPASELSGGVISSKESLPFAASSFDLVVASLSLHSVDDLLGVFLQVRHILKPDGLFLASLPVAPSFSELRHALMAAEEELTGKISPRIIPMPGLRDCAGLLQKAGFALPVVDKEEIKLQYSHPFSLLRDLQHAGESNALLERSKIIPPRALFPLALSKLQAEYGNKEGVLPCVLHVGCLLGWAPAESQPKPLRPGEYTTSLHDVIEGLVEDKS